jgi:hypothetical protein
VYSPEYKVRATQRQIEPDLAFKGTQCARAASDLPSYRALSNHYDDAIHFKTLIPRPACRKAGTFINAS